MENEPINGRVVLKLLLDEKGEPQKPTVVYASHPAFAPESLHGLFSTKFAPAMTHGLVVPSEMTFESVFKIDRFVRARGSRAFALPPTSLPSTPPQFRYDRPPVIVSLCDPVYPRDLLQAGTGGDADVVFVVNENGNVVAGKIMKASKPEFGAALLAAAETWRFEPGMRNGQRTATLLSRHYDFVPRVRQLYLGYLAVRVLKGLQTGARGEFLNTYALDHPLRVIYEVAPQYPRQFDSEHVTGEATIDFVIDEAGVVRFPQVVSATKPEFGWAAAAAVQQWFYDAPRSHGNPVDVHRVMTFEFKPGMVGGG